ncbi:MAG TPA: hypothetical protein VGC21_12090 [Telluria sp.]|jgi:hypothetical protein
MNLPRKRLLFGWIIGGPLLLGVLLYLVLLAINWTDAPVSAEARRLEVMAGRRPSVADADNGYRYLAATPSLRGQSPERRRKLAPQAQKLAAACRDVDGACISALAAGEQDIRAWLAADAWLLSHYEKIIGHSGWRIAPLAGPDAPAPEFAALFDGQRLFMLRAWTLAGAGDAGGVRTALEKDARFWRMALASSDDLLGKMIMTNGFQRNLAWGNIVLRRLPHALQSSAIPSQWRLPVSIDERSILSAVAGEMRFIGAVLAQRREQMQHADGTWNKVIGVLALPALKPQASMNDYAAHVSATTALFDIDYASLPAAKSKAKQMLAASSGNQRYLNGYNVLGKYLIGDERESVLKYVLRLADLEGMRLAALCTSQLRSEGVAPDQIAIRLTAAPLQSPYPARPFSWFAPTGSIVFEGLEDGDRGIHTFIY